MPIPPIIDMPDALDRLRFWQKQRAAEEERRRVEEAMAVPEKERSKLEEVTIAYSPFGSASRCGY